MPKKLNTEEFIEKARTIHGNKYDYSKVEYVNNHTKVCIICPEHGEFWQTPNSHLMGVGCPECYNKKRKFIKLKSQEQFINECNKIHNNKYDYSKTVYVKDNEKICIICPEHGEFWQTANAHLHGQGCPTCGYYKTQEYNKKRLNEHKNNFIKKVKTLTNIDYDYSKVEYKGSLNKVCIICPEHGEFWQTPSKLYSQHFCPKCGHRNGGNKLTSTTEDFIEKAKRVHGDKYNYSKVEYVNNHTKVCIICPEHGEFWQTPNSHLLNFGCPSCSQSHLENELQVLFNNNGILYKKEKTFSWLRNKSYMYLDFYLPDYNIAIECQGVQHFLDGVFFGSKNSQFKDIKYRDELKFKLCKSHNINLIYYTNINIDFEYLNLIFNDKNNLLEYITQ